MDWSFLATFLKKQVVEKDMVCYWGLQNSGYFPLCESNGKALKDFSFWRCVP